MSTSNEHVFVVGPSGAIETDVARHLVEKGIYTTAYVRNESKAKNLVKDELLTRHLAIVVVAYSFVDLYSKTIEGHSRLFLLAVGDVKRPTSMSEVQETFEKIAYEKGVRQIVDLSSFTVRSCGKQDIIGYMHTTCEEKLWTLADEKSNERLSIFMNNQFMSDIRSIKH